MIYSSIGNNKAHDFFSALKGQNFGLAGVAQKRVFSTDVTLGER